MIQTIYVTNPSGDTLTLSMRDSGENEGLIIFNMEGLGPPKATVSGTGGPNIHGVRASFVKVDARHIMLTLAIPITAAEETAKQKIYDYFPISKEITFRVASDTKNVNIQAIVESVEMNQFAKIENAVISLYCPDPYFASVGEQNVALLLNTPTNIPYAGELSTGIYMTFIFGGYLSEFTITNDNGSQSMTINFDSASPSYASYGDKLYIDTRFGQKSVFFRFANDYFVNKINLINDIDLNDDWIQLHAGDNLITATGTMTPHSDMPDPTDLVVYFPLNEIDGGNALELHAGKDFTKGSGAIGHIDERRTYDSARQFNYEDAPYFDNVVSDPDLCPTSDFTVAFWLYVDSVGTYRTVISSITSQDGFEVKIDSGNVLRFLMARGGTFYEAQLTVLNLQQWKFFIVWYDASAQTMYVQRDIGSPVTETSVPAPNSYSSICTIGSGGGGARAFDGRLQSIIFYDSILTLDERTYLFNTTSSVWGRMYAEVIGDIEEATRFYIRFEGV